MGTCNCRCPIYIFTDKWSKVYKASIMNLKVSVYEQMPKYLDWMLIQLKIYMQEFYPQRTSCIWQTLCLTYKYITIINA